VVPRTGKLIKNDLRDFEIGENLLQNGILHFVIVLQSYNLSRRKTDFSKRGLARVKKLKSFQLYIRKKRFLMFL